MRIIEGTKLDFDDVLLVPQYSAVPSRNISLEREYKFKYAKHPWKGVGIISANMDTCGSFAMAKELAKHQMLTALHKHYSVDELVKFFCDNPKIWFNVFYTIGMGYNDLEKLREVKKRLQSICFEDGGTSRKALSFIFPLFPPMLCVDVANGHTFNFVAYVRKIRNEFPQSVIMAGNVATGDMTKELILNGADIVKAGIGQGSACRTRLVAGVGYPQLSVADECSYDAHGLQGHVCSDGGITKPADAAKAFAAGADFICIGGLFAGTDECEGEWETVPDLTHDFDDDAIIAVGDYLREDISEDRYPIIVAKKDSSHIFLNNKQEIQQFVNKYTKKCLKFHGMSSKEAQEKWNGGLTKYRASEGKEVLVPYRGPVENVIQNLTGGIKSACTYLGACKIKDLPKCAEFVRVNRTHNTVFGQ